MNIYRVIATMAAWFLLAGQFNSALGGRGEISGEEEDIWTRDDTSVVIGRMTQIVPKKEPEEPANRAIFAPIATLCGSFDPALRTKIPVTFHSGGYGASIPRPPTEGSLVLAVIKYPDTDDDGKPIEAGYIRADACKFMPMESSLVMLRDMNDPVIQETLKKLQAARAKGIAKQKKEEAEAKARQAAKEAREAEEQRGEKRP